MADPVPAAAVTPASITVKPGWQTTEMYLAMLVCGVLTYGGNDLLGIVKVLLANPALPPWVAPLAMLAPVLVGGLLTKAAVEYHQLRVQLKLEAIPDLAAGPGAAAGGVAAAADPAKVLEAANK